MDIVSLGAPSVSTAYTFNTPFTILQIGPSNEYGSGTLTQSGDTLTGTEGDGIIEFAGPVSSLSWTATDPEFWNGFTFGAKNSVAVATAEPSTLLMLGTGLAALIGLGLRLSREDL
jgi:hypothetical protein